MIPMIGMVMAVGMLSAACTESGDEVPDFGQVRIDNTSSEPVFLFLNEEPRLTVQPAQRGNVAVDEGLLRISIRNAAGKELFEQLAEVPDNTFAEYIVLENGQVAAKAGNIRVPDVVGGDDEQIKLENLANFPVGIYYNDELLATAAPETTATVNVPGQIFFTVSFRRGTGPVLFQQSLKVPTNAVIHYAVLPDGTVIATGGPIEENTDILYPDKYLPFSY